MFYGAKNVGSGKFGKIIYIPAVSKVEDHTKLSGPSALRELTTSVLGSVIADSPVYASLTAAFSAFEQDIKAQETADGHSLKQLEAEIADELSGWSTGFAFEIQEIQPDDVIKTLVKPSFIDQAHGQPVDQARFGAGFQRSLIYALIKLAAKYARPAKAATGKKEFSPALNWILFEEPEAFLHPTQEDVLFDGLRTVSAEEGHQVLATTHSARFVSRTMSDLTRLVRLRRSGPKSAAYQLSADALDGLFAAATAVGEEFELAGVPVEAADKEAIMSALKYELWLNPHRASAFFSRWVILAEGPSEVALVSYLTSRGIFEAPVPGVAVVDCMGKYNLHRFMQLFGSFGIDHAVLYDGDSGGRRDVAIDASVERSKSAYTHLVHRFPKDLEEFLGIPKCVRKDRKPQHVLYHLEASLIDDTRLQDAVRLLSDLCVPVGVPEEGEPEVVLPSAV